MAAVAPRRAIAIAFVFVYLGMIIHPSASLEPLKIQRRFNFKTTLFFEETSFDGRRFAYAVCKDQSSGQVTRRCEVFLETLSPRTTRSCNVTLMPDKITSDRFKSNKSPNERYYRHQEIRVVPLGDDRVVLSWFASTMDDPKWYARVATVTIQSCTLHEDIQVPVPLRNYLHSGKDINVVPYADNTYDAFYVELEIKKETNKFGKWTVDVEKGDDGVHFASMRIKADKVGFGYALPSESQTKGFLFAANDKILITAKDLTKKLEIPLNSRPGISISNGMITICTPNCHRFNLTGDPIASTISVMSYNDNARAVHNLKSGDLLIASQVCEEGCEDGNHEPTYYVSRYTEKGELLGEMAMREFSCDLDDRNTAVLSFYGAEEQVCLMMACYRTTYNKDSCSCLEGSPHLDISTMCFNGPDGPQL